MRFGRRAWLLALALLGWAGTVMAQTGTLTGRITEGAAGRPLAGAAVLALDAGGAEAGRAVTGSDGRYRIGGLGAGSYTVEARAVGYEPNRSAGVAVSGAASATADVVLQAKPVQLEAVTIAAERGEVAIKVVDAPAAISVIPTVEITDRPALTIVDHLKGLPGVDVSTGGLVQSNVVGRGFNNIFSGALLTLIDNRFAAVPSLRVNVPAFFTATDQDIQQAEFVLGPGAALYGPNTANGVLAISTKSPFNQQGGTVSLETGLRSGSQNADGESFDDGSALARFGFRYSHRVSPRVAFKLSGEYLTGTEWRMRDPLEPTPPAGQPDLECDDGAGGCRDFDLRKYNFDARVDMIPGENTQLVASFGQSNSGSLIEYTGIGAGQAKDWKYSYGQVRFNRNRLFVQAFANFSNAGETFLLRTGAPIVDRSRVYAAQAQHGTDLGSRATLTYGVDFAYTDARTDNTINGRNEDDDTINEIGGYAHSVIRLAPRWDLVGALRVDKHSRLDDPRLSPRGALVYKPNDNSSLRVTYNRAFSTPSNNNLFLDILAGSLPAPFFMNIRAIGTPEGGFHFRGYCGAGGLDELCMRRDANAAVPVDATSQWGYATTVALGILLPNLPANLQPAVQGVLQAIPAPTGAQVGTQLRRWERTSANAAGIQWVDIGSGVVQDIDRTEPTSSNVLEIGYKGIFADKLRFDANVWFERRRNFVGPLIVESPNVFLDPASTLAYLQATFQPALTQTLIQAGLPEAQAQATAAQVTGSLAGVMAGQNQGNPLEGQAGVPVGTVVPDSPLTGTGDIFFTYRNFGKVNLWGTDLSFDYLIDDRWSVGGAYSFVNKDFFSADDVDGPTDVALNAPKNKGALALRYAEGLEGFAAEARGRFVQGFPINSGDYQTPLRADGTREPIDDYTVLDATVSYRFASGLLASLAVQNVLNESYQTFVGLPLIGRLVLTRLTYTF